MILNDIPKISAEIMLMNVNTYGNSGPNTNECHKVQFCECYKIFIGKSCSMKLIIKCFWISKGLRFPKYHQSLSSFVHT